jgi:hypothetical protein
MLVAEELTLGDPSDSDNVFRWSEYEMTIPVQMVTLPPLPGCPRFAKMLKWQLICLRMLMTSDAPAPPKWSDWTLAERLEAPTRRISAFGTLQGSNMNPAKLQGLVRFGCLDR